MNEDYMNMLYVVTRLCTRWLAFVLFIVGLAFYMYYDETPTSSAYGKQPTVAWYDQTLLDIERRKVLHTTTTTTMITNHVIKPPTMISYCPIMSLDVSNNSTTTDRYRNTRCKPIPLEEKDCRSASIKYKKPTSVNNHCPKQHPSQVILNLCIFKEMTQSFDGGGSSAHKKYTVICKINKCKGSAIRISNFQTSTGMMTSYDHDVIVYKKGELETALLYMYGNTEETFCQLACHFQTGFIRQLLVFPPRVIKKRNGDKSNPEHYRQEKININIVVLDSVSRQHFYRQLPQSVSELRNIRNFTSYNSRNSNREPSSKQIGDGTLVLDYELFQSLAPRTFPNIRAMVSGVVDVDSDDEANSYGLEVLYGNFQKLGYQTLLQEDSCWYDSWGALLTDNKHRENITFDWPNIRHKTEALPIDTYGLTHFSCHAFAQYGQTNQFNFPPKVCFNGHLFPGYFLNFTLNYMEAIEEKSNAKPGFFYTHLNTAHEMTGQRLSQIDEIFSQFIYRSSRLPNTLTIIMSDHGPKTTRYSQETLAGRFEIGHALMFMIIPQNIQEILGVQKTRFLMDNQRRLISTVDIYKMFKTLHDKSGEGLLGYIPESRYCHDIPVYSFMNCLCSEATELIQLPYTLQWMAEYALGFLNNRLTESLLAYGYRYGYHNCERLIGHRFNKVRRSSDHSGSYTYIMDIVVDKYRGEEIFEVVLKAILNNPQRTGAIDFKNIEVVKWRRVSIYQHFSKCVDQHVNIELCICRQESTGLRNPGRDLSRVFAIPVFGAINIPIFIDSKCLLLLKRGRVNSFLTYELSNLCNDRVYEAKFQLVNSYARVKTTRKLPLIITLRSWFIHYITTIVLDQNNLKFPLENVTFIMKYI